MSNAEKFVKDWFEKEHKGFYNMKKHVGITMQETIQLMEAFAAHCQQLSNPAQTGG